MRRLARWRWMLALSGCLAAGCLFHKPGELSAPYPTEPETMPVVVEMPPVDPPPSPTPSPALPDYNLHPTTIRQPAYFEPLAPVNLQMGSTTIPPSEVAKTTPTTQAKPVIPELVSALQGAVEKHPVEARQLLNESDRSDREQLLSLVRLAAGIDQKELEKLSAEELSKILEQLRVLTTQLRRHAPLRLDKVCFCKQIDGFGQYQTLAGTAQFQAGCDGRPGDRIQVYAEVRNFISQAKEEKYETRLSSSLEILDEQRRPVATMTPETSVDSSQTPRQDYFLNFQFHVPAHLKPGSYTLKVTVKDLAATPSGQKRTSRTDKRTLDFRICPPGAIRAVKAVR